ncbi:RTA1-domain-containing protein [Xylariomycetidae sp. FL0641]|nr:RTA1-domain-containing protein [Xylariomycetidae sp. FL0641]
MSDDKFANCTLSTCDVSTSRYGYRPNLGLDVFFAAVYGLAILFCLAVSLWKRRWIGYSVSVGLGSVLELTGYVARIQGYHDPWAVDGWTIQYALITLGPIFMTAAIYVSIGRLADHLGRGRFNIRPRLYPRVFIPSDIVALLIQAAGGGISISETKGDKQVTGVSTGSIITVIGLVFQVVSLFVFFVLFLGVAIPSGILRRRDTPAYAEVVAPAAAGRYASDKSTATTTTTLPNRKRVRVFVVVMMLAIFLIFARSIYRVVEISGGVASGLIQDQTLFIILDSFPVGIATALITIFHPIFMLPAEQRQAESSGSSLTEQA